MYFDLRKTILSNIPYTLVLHTTIIPTIVHPKVANTLHAMHAQPSSSEENQEIVICSSREKGKNLVKSPQNRVFHIFVGSKIV